MDCSPPGSSVLGILQARIQEWVAMPFSSGSLQPRDRTQVLCIAGRFFTIWATRKALKYITVQFSRSVVSDSWRPVKYSTPGLPVHCQLTEFTQTHVHCVGDTIQPSHPSCCPLHLLPSIFPSIKVFSNESVLLIRWPKYWSFSFSISPANEWLGLISFRMDWLDLLAVQGTLKSLLQHHSSKVSIFWCSAFFTV